jgi:hypothetical protein
MLPQRGDMMDFAKLNPSYSLHLQQISSKISLIGCNSHNLKASIFGSYSTTMAILRYSPFARSGMPALRRPTK